MSKISVSYEFFILIIFHLSLVEGRVCRMTRDAGGPTVTDRAARGLSRSGCIKKCFKKCGKSKTKIDLACRKMTATEWGCGCCCSNDHYAPI
ncbi:hypothetical protein MKX01_036675 [Papaver californicum]|nr:hypothetical protein MKX01_036675 [Papaver californicum]